MNLKLNKLYTLLKTKLKPNLQNNSNKFSIIIKVIK